MSNTATIIDPVRATVNLAGATSSRHRFVSHKFGRKIAPFDQRSFSRLAVMRTTQLMGQATQPDLSEATGLGRTVVLRACRELCTIGLLEVSGHARRKEGPGRPAKVFSMNPEAFHVMGLFVGWGKTVGIVLDAGANVIDEWTVDVDLPEMEKAIVKRGVEGVAERLADDPKICSVGIACERRVEHETGVSRQQSQGSTRSEPIAVGEAMEHHYGLPAFVDRHIFCEALAEARLGIGRGEEQFLYAHLGSSVGLAHVTGGDVHRGAWGYGGALPHVSASRSQDLNTICPCGRADCIHPRVLVSYIVEKARELFTRGLSSLLADLCENDPSKITFAMILEAAQAKDRLALTVLEEVAEALATALSAAIDVLDPGLLVLGGAITGAGDVLLELLGTSLRRQSFRWHLRLGRLRYLLGFVGLALAALWRRRK